MLGCEIAKNGDRDGIPNVLVESLAMGVPAVSTAVSALPELLIDGRTGLTVEPKNSAAFARAITRLLTDTELRERIIREGRTFVHDHFDNKKLITELAAVFASIQPSLLPAEQQAQ